MADQAYGGFWVRVVAYLVDTVVVSCIAIVLAFVASLLGDVGLKLIPLLFLLTPIAYWGLMQASARQATLGKALLGMKVTDVSGERMSLLRSFGRELAKIASGIPFGLGYVMAAFTGRKQALHDMVASTTVLRESPGHVLIGLLVGVFGWIAPVALAMFIGGALIAAMMGTMGGDVFRQAMTDSPKRVAPRRTPSASRPAAPAAAPEAPAQPVASPPGAAQVVASAPAPSPKPAAVPEPAKPVAAPEPSKQVARADPTPKPAAVSEKMASAPEPPASEPQASEPTPIRSMPSRPGPKYNDLMTAVMVADPAAVQELLAFGKWPDKPDSNGVTPLMAAVMRGDRDSAELLLKAGADPDRAHSWSRQRGDPAMTALLERYLRR